MSLVVLEAFLIINASEGLSFLHNYLSEAWSGLVQGACASRELWLHWITFLIDIELSGFLSLCDHFIES